MLPLMESDALIAGIYNYCDRWCERCAFIDRCRLGTDDQLRRASHRAAGRNPDDWEVVLEDVKQSFEETITMLREDAQRMGIDIDSAENEADLGREAVMDHPLHRAAFELMKKIHDFLGEHGPALRAELDRQALGERAAAVEDALDTLEWYHTQIPSKIFRALVDVCGEVTDGQELDDFEKADADGSAKVAHLGLTRSMKALMALQDLRPWLRKESMSLMLMIANLIEAIDKRFPDHKTFKRPGLDE